MARVDGGREDTPAAVSRRTRMPASVAAAMQGADAKNAKPAAATSAASFLVWIRDIHG